MSRIWVDGIMFVLFHREIEDSRIKLDPRA